MDFVSDERLLEYFRIYVGQSKLLICHIEVYIDKIEQEECDSLHSYISFLGRDFANPTLHGYSRLIVPRPQNLASMGTFHSKQTRQ